MVARRFIPNNVQRRLYAESMGRCMNPRCECEILNEEGYIGEIAHINPHSITQDDSYDNLILLCPNCHKDFDKNHKFSADEVRQWKIMRKKEIDEFYCKKFKNFEELKEAVRPLLERNKEIYENYYLNNRKELWDFFESEVILNNRKIELYLVSNKELIQISNTKDYSNQHYIDRLIVHIREFERTRLEDERFREVLFPKEVDSIFGVERYQDSRLYSLTACLEELVKRFINQGNAVSLYIDEEDPYILVGTQKLYMNDTPNIRQLVKNNNIYCKDSPNKMRFESLNFILKYLKKNEINYKFEEITNFRRIIVEGNIIEFVYIYCLSRFELERIAPKRGTIIVNLHNWNGIKSISQDARNLATNLGIYLFSQDEFYEYIGTIKHYR